MRTADLRPEVPHTNGARRAAPATSVLLAAVLLAGCGTSAGEGGTEPRPADQSAHGDHAGGDDAGTGGTDEGDHAGHETPGDLPVEFAQALEQVSTDRGREILADGVITGAELGDLEQARADCLAAEGYDAVVEDGELQIRSGPGGLDETGVAQAVQDCLGDLEVVAPLHAQASGTS